MSNTLKELFVDFRRTFGLFRIEDSADAKFLAERQLLIEEALEQLEAGNFYEAYLALSIRGGELNGITSGDPIPSLLLLRCADEAVRVGLNAVVRPEARYFVFELLEANRSAATGWSSLNLAMMLDEMKEVGGGPRPASQDFKRLYDTTRYLWQYALFRNIGQILDNKMKMRGTLGNWRKEGFDTFFDYSNVHPFATALCPPYHIWPKFIYDGDLCEVQTDGSLKRTALVDCDPAKVSEPQKPFAFLHIVNQKEIYQPKKA